MRKSILLQYGLFIFSYCFSQDAKNLPADYLSKEFHADRREALRRLMPPNSIAVIFAYPERVFSQDVNYTYHQNPDLYYFSGYNEPRSVLFIFRDQQTTADNKKYNELFFIQKKDPLQESWTGRRMGVAKVKSELGFDMVFDGSEFKNFTIDFSKFDQVLLENLPSADNDASDSADLFDLAEQLKQKAGFPKDYNREVENSLGYLVQYGNLQNLHYFTDDLKKMIASGEVSNQYAVANQLSLQDIVDIRDQDGLDKAKEKLKVKKINTVLYNKYVSSLREIKTPEELKLLAKAVNISSVAHAEVMKAIRPGMSERELQAIFEFVHKKYGAEEEGYPPIVGAGDNGCILHYEENSNTNFGNDMVLMDVAAEYHGYSADVTRTVPSTGKFSPEQKAIYDLVYKAQEEVFKLCKEGSTFTATENKATEVLADGLVQLGIIKNKNEVRTYYPHGCSHFIGLDVHDKGDYQKLMANMAITVEPGIYIPPNSPCDKKWWGIAVRIEDDILITKEGYELLSKDAPRKSEDVEKMIAQKSILNDFMLPKLAD
jgi:Xaa-Pro aminopeptidase